MKPLLEKDIPENFQAIRQAQSRKMLLQFLTRVKVSALYFSIMQVKVIFDSDYGRCGSSSADHATARV